MPHPHLPLAAAVAALALAGPAAAKPPQQFLKDAIQGDNSEMRLGRLAEQNASQQGVRDFGRTLAADHAQARKQAVQVAQQLGVQPPGDMTPEASQEQKKLEGLSGASFDREFVSYMVRDHKKDIQSFEQQAKEGGPTADLARRTLPALRKHLQIAEGLQK